MNEPIEPLRFSLKGDDSDSGSIVVKAQSSNQALIPNENIRLDPMAQTIKIQPVSDQLGSAEIRLSAVDARGSTAAASFQIHVKPPSSRPAISPVTDQVAARNLRTDPIAFKITDADTPPTQISTDVFFSDWSLIWNVQILGTGSDRALSVFPTTNRVGRTDVTLTATDPDGFSSSTHFILDILPTAFPPSISPIPNQTNLFGMPISDVRFNVADLETPAERLNLSARSSNQALIANTSLLPGGAGKDRILSMTATPNAFGSAVITVTATDTDGQSSDRTFEVTVLPPPSPLISDISNHKTRINRPISIAFWVEDKNFTPEMLTVSAVSSDQKLVPDEYILFSGTGRERQMVIFPAPEQTGVARITLTIANRYEVASARSFYVAIERDEVSPNISAIPRQSTTRNQPIARISFQLEQPGMPLELVNVTAASSNQTLVPDANILVTGAGRDREISIVPALNQLGTVSIILTASDLFGRSSTQVFDLDLNSTLLPLKNDLNADGQADFVFDDTSSPGSKLLWFMNGVRAATTALVTPTLPQNSLSRFVGMGDFDLDGNADLLCQHANGLLEVWLMDRSGHCTGLVSVIPQLDDPKWKAITTDDFNNDGKVDVLFQHENGTLAVWLMTGLKLSSGALLVPDNPGERDWRAVATGDFNLDGSADLLFQHRDGTLALWYLDGLTLVKAALTEPSNPGEPGWRACAAADLDRDGQVDIIFQHVTDGSLVAWRMENNRLLKADWVDPRRPGGSWRMKP